MNFTERLALIITANADQALREIHKVGGTAERELGKATTSSEKFAGSAIKIGAGMVAAGGLALPALARLGQKASDLNEQISGSTVVFRENAGEVKDWSASLASSFGISQRAALTSANNFGAMFSGLGIAGDEATVMAKKLVELSADLSSFKNLAGGSEEALERLRSGLAGEAEPLRRLDIFLNEAAVGAKAMELGLAGAGDKLTDSQKVLARYHLILDQTNLAQGDFERTSGSLANQQRILAAETENSAGAFGQGVVGPMTAATKAIGGAVSALGDLSPEMAKTAGTVATLGAATTVGVGALALLSGAVIKAKENFTTSEGALTGFGKAAKGLSVVGGVAGGVFLLQGALEALTTSASEAAAEVIKLSDLELGKTFDSLVPKDNALTKILDAIPLGANIASDAFEELTDQQAKFFDALPLEQQQRLVDVLKEQGRETGELEAKIKTRARAEAEAAASTDKAKKSLEGLTGATDANTEATEDETKATEESAKAQKAREERIRDVLEAMEDLISSQLGVAGATDALQDSQAKSAEKERELAEAIKAHGRNSAEAHEAAAELNEARRGELSDIDALAKAHRDFASQQATQAGRPLTVAESYRIYRDELIKIKDAIAPGSPLRVHLEELINQLPPPEVKFKVLAEIEQAMKNLAAIQRAQDALGLSSPFLAKFVPSAPVTPRAHGGPSTGLTLVGEEGPELLNLGSRPHYVTDAQRTAELLGAPAGASLVMAPGAVQITMNGTGGEYERRLMEVAFQSAMDTAAERVSRRMAADAGKD